MGGEGGMWNPAPKSSYPHPTDNQWVRAFLDGGREPSWRNSTVSSDSHLEINWSSISGQISIISIVFSAVCLQLQDWMVPISLSGEGNGTPLQYSCLENPMDRGAWRAAVHEVPEGRTRLSDFTFTHWRRKWRPTPVFLPGESQGRGSLVGCHLWGNTELDTTEVT